MERVTIVVPYYNRPKALERLMDYYLKYVDTNKFSIYISKYTPSKDGVFNTGKAQNDGVLNSDTNWILKQDVDCIPENPDLYEYIYRWVQIATEFQYKIFGAKYLNAKDELITSKLFCGNEYLFHKKLWEKVKGVPEWEGYGWEDYAFEYKLEKEITYKYKIEEINENNVSDKIRDNLTYIKNQQEPYYFLHYYHPVNINRTHLIENKRKLYELVKSYND